MDRKSIFIVFSICFSLIGCTQDTSVDIPIYPTRAISKIVEIEDEFNHHMVLIPSGVFYSRDMKWSYLNKFYVDKYEVTIGQYLFFLDSIDYNPNNSEVWFDPEIPGYKVSIIFDESSGNWIVDEDSKDFPIVGVTWFGAQAYCEWRGGDLPSVDQFVKASRGIDRRPYPWGYDQPNCEKIGVGDCTGDWFHKIGQFPTGASPYGVMDVLSNTDEWTRDSWNNVTGDSLEPSRMFVWPGSVFIEEYPIIGVGFPKISSESAYYIGFRCVVEP